MLGDDHPDTLTTMNNLALALGALGDSDDAVAPMEQTVDGAIRTWGPEHPNTITNTANLKKWKDEA